MNSSGGFFDGLVRRPVTLLVIFVTLCVTGGIAYSRIPLQMMPSGFQSQSLLIWAQNPGSSPQENEQQVARPLEEGLRTVAGIEDIQSWSNEDSVNLRVRFSADQNSDLIKAEVRDRIERTRASLPDTVDRVQIFSWNQSELPLMWLAILARSESDRNDYLMDAVITRRLESVDGVGQAQVYGVLDDSVRILLDEDRVRAARLDIGQLIRRLSADNFAMPMGEVEDGGRRILLRSDMRFRSVEEIEAYPIGGGLTIGDVGRVIRAKSVRDELARINGSYAYWGVLRREGTANVVATCRRLRAAFDELRADPRLADEFDFVLFFDQGRFIETSLGQLRETALWGGGLALVVLFAFLRRFRLTLCVALSIPVSVLMSIAWAYFSGGSFNILTMSGITLALGMLVDNSVVVIENISRLRADGLGNREATVRGTREVALAVALATLTTVVVFLPMIFMTSNPELRIIFGELGLPLCLSLIFSLLVALAFLPVAAARAVGPRPAPVERAARALAPLAALPGRTLAWMVGAARLGVQLLARPIQRLNRIALAILVPLRFPLAGALGVAAGWRLLALWKARAAAAELASVAAAPSGAQPARAVLGVALPALFAVVLVLFTAHWRRRPARAPRAPSRYVPRGGLLELIVASNRALVGWSLRHRLLASGLAFLAFASIALPRARMQVSAFGQDESSNNIEMSVDLDPGFTLEQAAREFARYEDFFEARRQTLGFDNLAVWFDRSDGQVSLWWDEPQGASLERVKKEIRETIPRWPGHHFRMSGGDEDADSRLKTVVAWQLYGPDPDQLERVGRQALERLEELPGLSSLSTSVAESPDQVRLLLDSEVAHRLGVSAEVALQNVSWALRGFPLPRFQEPGREIPLSIEYDEEEVAGLDTLRDLQIWTGTGAVPLTSVARIAFTPGPTTIYRKNGKTAFTITGRVDDPAQQEAVSQAGYALLSSMDLPRGYGVGEEDLVSNRSEAELAELKSALALSVVLVFLLMGILFESFLLPFSVLFTIPFAATGAFWTLYLTHTTMDSVGWIGIIILVGVVVNNGIVLIDRIHRLRARHRDRRQAVLEGCATRVRPILMTALTTVFGLLPMAVAEPPAEGIDYRALATCVAGGLAFSTFFTLWVVPLAYTVLDDLSATVAAWARWTFSLRRRPDPARISGTPAA